MSYKYQLPEGYGYVIAAGAFTGVALYITSSLAQAQRSKLGVEYPNLYASDVTAKQDKRAYEFNCHQRGALNPHESHPITLFGLAFGGLTFPIPAAAAGAAWGAGSLLYYWGYASGSPNERYSKGGILLRLSTLALVGMSGVTAFNLIYK